MQYMQYFMRYIMSVNSSQRCRLSTVRTEVFVYWSITIYTIRHFVSFVLFWSVVIIATKLNINTTEMQMVTLPNC